MPPSPKPRWIWAPVRVLLVTVLLTLLAFAVSLLLGILGIVVGARARGSAPDLTLAYRHIALPAAVVVAAVVLVLSVALEVRHSRQAGR